MSYNVEEARFTETVEAIYAAAVDAAAWPAALAKLADVFSGSFVDIFTRSHDREHFSGLAHGLDRADYEDIFLGFWFKRNVWGQTRPVEVAGEVVSTRQMVDVATLRRSEIFAEYLDPRGLHEGLRLSLWVGEREIQDVSILRPWSSGAYGPAEVALGEALLPHLQRAAAVTRSSRGTVLRHELGDAGPTAGAVAAFAFDREGRPFWFNAAAEAVLARGALLRIYRGSLQTNSQKATRALQRALAGAIRQDAPLPVGSAVVLPHVDGEAGPNLIVLPLSSAGDWALSRPPAAVAFLRDPSTLTLSEAGLRRMFALTGAEIELARHLLEGRTLRGAAEVSGCSFNTVRTHLAHLMTKTGTHRQVDLVRLLNDVATVNVP